jgi:outer membrane receptor for ferrienterochelin and colicins
MNRKLLMGIIFFLPTLFFSEDSTKENFKKENSNVIVVTGTRRTGLLKDSVITSEVISKDDIKKMGARTIAESLIHVPGIEVKPAAAGQRGEVISIQGLSAQNVLILVDGQRTTGRFSGAVDLTRFKVEDIERIEIVKGASSSLYGSDAIAGVINIITKEAKDGVRAEFKTLYGSGRELYYGKSGEFRNTASVGIKKEIISTQFTVGWHRGDGYDLTPDSSLGPKSDKTASLASNYNPYPRNMPIAIPILFNRNGIAYSPPLENTTGNAFEDKNISNKTVLKPNKNLTLTSTTFYRYLDQSGVDSVLPRTIYDRRNQTHDLMTALDSDLIINSKWNLNLNLNRSRFLDNFHYDQRKSDELDRKETTDNSVTEFRSRIDRKSELQTISIGAESLIDELSSPRIARNCRREFPNLCIDESRGFPATEKNGTAFRQRNAVFIQDEITLNDKKFFKVIPGIRHENDSIYGSQTLPKLALRFDPLSNLKIRTSIGLGYRAPSFQDLYFNFQNPGAGYRVVGNENLRPELSKNYNLGAEWQLSPSFWISGNLFWNAIDNLIGFRAQGNRDSSGLLVFQTSNYLRAETKGLESSLNYKLNQSLNFGLGYTYTLSNDKLTNLPLEGRGTHRYNFSSRFDYAPTGSGISIFAVLFGKQPFYCPRNFLGCAPETPEYLNTQITISTRNPFYENIPEALSIYCTERNISICAKEFTNGVRYVNQYVNLNFRIYQKFVEAFEVFLGVDNALESFDTRYNPQRPRYMYFGFEGKLSGS